MAVLSRSIGDDIVGIHAPQVYLIHIEIYKMVIRLSRFTLTTWMTLWFRSMSITHNISSQPLTHKLNYSYIGAGVHTRWLLTFFVMLYVYFIEVGFH